MSKLIKLELTSVQLDTLIDILEDHNDCGPMHEGWQSMELVQLKCTVESYKLDNKYSDKEP